MYKLLSPRHGPKKTCGVGGHPTRSRVNSLSCIAPEETGSASFGQLNAAGSAEYMISIAFISSGPPHLPSFALSAFSWKMHSFRTHMRSKILSNASRLKIGHCTFAGEHGKIHQTFNFENPKDTKRIQKRTCRAPPWPPGNTQKMTFLRS